MDEAASELEAGRLKAARRRRPRLSSKLQAALLDLAQQAISSSNIQDVLIELTRRVKKFLKADAASLVLIEDTNLARLIYDPVEPTQEIAKLTSYMLQGNGLTGRAYQTGQLIATEDYFHDSSFQHDALLDAQARRLGLIASLVAPVLLKDKVVAMLWLGKLRPYSWKEADFFQVQQFADMTGRLLYQAAELERQKLEVVEALANTAAHDLIQQLAVIQALLDLNLKLGQPLDTDTLHVMQEAVTTMTRQIREYRRIARINVVEPVPGIIMLDRTKSLRPEEE